MKMKYDESDNTFIRASRALTDKVSDLIGKWDDVGANSGVEVGAERNISDLEISKIKVPV